MTAAVRVFVPACLETFDLDRIFATTSSKNPASARVLEKAGFTFKGGLHKNVIKADETLDSLMYAWVREDSAAQ